MQNWFIWILDISCKAIKNLIIHLDIRYIMDIGWLWSRECIFHIYMLPYEKADKMVWFMFCRFQSVFDRSHGEGVF